MSTAARRQSARLFARAQKILPGGVDSPVRAFSAVGGAPPFIRRGRGARIEDEDGAPRRCGVPDQLKSAITRPCRYEARVNRTYEDLAAHYGRGRHPRAAEETSRQGCGRELCTHRPAGILARLRDQTFFELGALNDCSCTPRRRAENCSALGAPLNAHAHAPRPDARGHDGEFK